MLSEYFGRTNIEYVFKTGQEYLDLLPLSKRTDATVRGIVTVETTCKQVKTYYKLFQMDVPVHVKMDDFRSKIYLKM